MEKFLVKVCAYKIMNTNHVLNGCMSIYYQAIKFLSIRNYLYILQWNISLTRQNKRTHYHNGRIFLLLHWPQSSALGFWSITMTFKPKWECMWQSDKCEVSLESYAKFSSLLILLFPLRAFDTLQLLSACIQPQGLLHHVAKNHEHELYCDNLGATCVI